MVRSACPTSPPFMRARARTCLIHVPVLTHASAACVSQRIDEMFEQLTTSELHGIFCVFGAVAAAMSASGIGAGDARCESRQGSARRRAQW